MICSLALFENGNFDKGPDEMRGTTSSSLRPVNTCPPPADLITMGRIYNNIAENSDLKKVDPHFQFSCRPSINCLVNRIANQHFFSNQTPAARYASATATTP